MRRKQIRVTHGTVGLLAAVALCAAMATNANAASRYINFEFDQVGVVGGTDTGYSGGLWVDRDTTNDGGNVFGVHNFVPGSEGGNDHIKTSHPLANDNRPDDVNGHYAAQWQFTVTGSSGDNWDDVTSGGTWEFSTNWDGVLLNDNKSPVEEYNMEEVFFSHIGTFADTHGQWIDMNNQSETPGEQLEDVWTSLQIKGDLDPLTGSTGVFALIASDPDNVMGLRGGNPIDGSDDSGDYAAYIGTTGSGTLTAVPTPAAGALGLVGFGLLALRRRRRNEAV